MPQTFKNKKTIITLFTLVLFLIIAVFCFCNFNYKITNVAASGEAWLSEGIYRKPITITNSSTSFTVAGTVSGNPVLGSAGKFSTAINLDGTGDYISIPDSDDWNFAAGDFTIDTWVKFTNVTDTGQGIVRQLTSSGTDGFTLVWNSTDGLAFYVNGSTIPVKYAAFSPTINTWYHVAVTRNSNTWRIFLNGAVVATGTSSVTITNSSQSLEIGKGATFSSNWSGVDNFSLIGYVDEFRISKGVARWTAAFTSPTLAHVPDLYTKLLLHLDEAVGLTSVSSDNVLTNYQVKLNLSYVSSKMNADFSDIRFTSSDGSTELSYWIESYVASTSAVVWVKVPSLIVGATTIYMYYGNSSATTTSSGDNTFAFFDNFTGTSFDSVKWDTQTSPTVSGGYAVFRSSAAAWQSALSKYAADDARNYEIYARYKLVDNSEQRLFHGWGAALTPASPIVPACSYKYSYDHFYANYASTYTTVAWVLETWYTTKHRLDTSYYQTVTLVENGTATNTSAIAFDSTAHHVFFGLNYGGGDVDWVFVKKYAATEPTTSLGAEESLSPFDYQESLLINNTSYASALTNYQVLLTIDTASLISAGKMKSLCEDIRFSDSISYDMADWTNNYHYWIESGCNTATTKIWIKVDTIAALSNKTIYMYYGRSDLSAFSSGDNTFIFFDDFTEATIDTAKWKEYDTGSNINQTGDGLLTITNGTGAWTTTGIYSIPNFNRADGIVVQGKYKSMGSSAGYSYKDTTMLWTHNTTDSVNHPNFIYALYLIMSAATPTVPSLAYYEKGSPSGGVTGTWAAGAQYIIRQIIKTTAGATTQMSSDGGVTWPTYKDSTTATSDTPLKVGFTHYGGGPIYIDDIIVRKYVSPEPTVTISSPPTATNFSVATENDSYLYCDYYYVGNVLTAGKNGNLKFQFEYGGFANSSGYRIAIGTSSDVNSADFYMPSSSTWTPTSPAVPSGGTIAYEGTYVKESPSSAAFEIGYGTGTVGKTYHWWVKLKNANGIESDWIDAGTFVTPKKHYPIVKVMTNKDTIEARDNIQYCSGTDLSKQTLITKDNCYDVCWKGTLGAADPANTNWKCSVCYDATGDAVSCSTLSDGDTTFTWKIPLATTEYELVSGTLTSANPVIKYKVSHSAADLKVGLNITGSACGNESGVFDIGVRMPTWVEISPF